LRTGEENELTRRFAAGPATFVVRCPSAEIRTAIEVLFVDLPDGSSADDCSEIALIVAGDGLLELKVEGGRHVAPQDIDGAIASMVTAVSRLALDADPERLHLHCAGLSLDGKGVLISAASGTGKTTLAAALTRRGWSYVSDEAVALESDSSTAFGFPKPLGIKPSGRDLVPELAAGRVDLGLVDELWWHVPARSLAAAVETELTPSVIVILHRAPDGSTDTVSVATPIHPVDAVVALMGQTMDPQRFGAHAVAVLANLAARCSCVTLPVGPLDAAASVLEQLAKSTVEVDEVEEFERTAASDTGVHPWQVSDSVRSVRIGDRVVVHETEGGAIAGLDEAGSAVWRALYGSPPAWWEPEMMQSSGTRAFLDQLVSHGMLFRSDPEKPTEA